MKKQLGYWDGISPMTYCYIDSNDRFHFSDKVIKIHAVAIENEAGPNEPVIYEYIDETGKIDEDEIITDDIREKYRKGCDFFSCKNCGWSYLFLDHRNDGIYFNDSIVFTKEELLKFYKKEIDNSYETDNDESSQNNCDCPLHRDYKKWEKKYPKYLWTYIYVSNEDTNDTDENFIVKKDGIQFSMNDEKITVGIDGAWIGFQIPIIEDT